MPLYEYVCNGCKQAYKAMHGVSESSTECSHCASPDVIKKLPILNNIQITSKEITAGQRVEKFIEEGKQAYKEQLAEARKDIEL